MAKLAKKLVKSVKTIKSVQKSIKKPVSKVKSKLKKAIKAEQENNKDQIEDTKVNSLLFTKRKCFLNEETVKSGIESLLKLDEKFKKEKPLLPVNEETPVFVTFAVIKIPKCPNRMLRFTLAHSIINKDSEICLITKDVPKEEKDFESNIEKTREILDKFNIDNVKTIIPFRQLKNEYSDYEMQRRLVELYDLFLIDARVRGHFAKKFQKVFMGKRKMPVSVKMQASNLKQQFDKAVLRTQMKLHTSGDTYTVQVGHTQMSKQELFDNVLSIHDGIDDEFPGGFNNVRRLLIKTDKSMAIPLYETLKINSDVMIPVVKPKRPKGYRTVYDEVSEDINVKVTPFGDVYVDGEKNEKKIKKNKKKIGKKEEKFEC